MKSPSSPSREAHRQRCQRLVDSLAAAPDDIRLGKDTSNLFRSRVALNTRSLDVRDFTSVLEVNPKEGWVDVEGMTTYEDLVAATLPFGVMPMVVPQLKSITIGGAVTGIGIESSSFRYGLPHESVIDMDILTGDGQIVTASASNDCSDLYYGFANSYGTLGYALRLKIRTVPVKPFVELTHHRFESPERNFEALGQFCEDPEVDFVDGVVFGDQEHYVTTGRFVDHSPQPPSDYTWMKMYFKSIREKQRDWLSVEDYIWRWDTDWFWCSKNVFAQSTLVRVLAGRERLNSVTYQKIMRWNDRTGVMRSINRWRGVHTESVIQDVDIPIQHACEFLQFFHREIGIKPIWTCPTKPLDPAANFDLFPMNPETLYVNFGFWDVIKTRDAMPAGHFNRLVEAKVRELGGLKSLYSDSFYKEDEFWALFDGKSYRALKSRYDSAGRFKDLYQKCVLRV